MEGAESEESDQAIGRRSPGFAARAPKRSRARRRLALADLPTEALEDVFASCLSEDLKGLRATCRLFRDVLVTSQRVALAQLEREYSLRLEPKPGDNKQAIELVRTIERTQTAKVAFRGVLCSGGVDADEPNYWVGNLFSDNAKPYCSAAGSNADCLALLLDGHEQRDNRYEVAREYMARMCLRPAAVFFANEGAVHVNDSELLCQIRSWSEAELESFFQSFVGALMRHEPMGQLMLEGIELGQVATETRRLVSVIRYLEQRRRLARSLLWAPFRGRNGQALGRAGSVEREHELRARGTGAVDEGGAAWLVPPGEGGREEGAASREAAAEPGPGAGPGGSAGPLGPAAVLGAGGVAPREMLSRQAPWALCNRDLLLDHSMVDRLKQRVGEDRIVLIEGIELSRAGALTCPVRSGAVFVGLADRPRMTAMPIGELNAALISAAASPACSALDSMTSPEALLRASAEGRLPPIVASDEYPAGEVHEFSTEPECEPSAWRAAEGPNAALRLRPLLWFRYKSRDEFAAFVRAHRDIALRHHSEARVRHRGPAVAHALNLDPTTADEARRLRASEAGSPGRRAAVGGNGAPGTPGLAASEEVAGGGPRRGQEGGTRGLAPSFNDGAALAAERVDLVIDQTDIEVEIDGDQGGDGEGSEADPGQGVEPAESGSAEVDLEAESDSTGEIDLEAESDSTEGLNGEVESSDGETGEAASTGEGGEPGENGDFLEEDLETDEEADWPRDRAFEAEAFEGAVLEALAPPRARDGQGAGRAGLQEAGRDYTLCRNRLTARLVRPIPANALMVKLIDQEDLMVHFDDEGPPNLDMTHVGVRGRLVSVPPSLAIRN